MGQGGSNEVSKQEENLDSKNLVVVLDKVLKEQAELRAHSYEQQAKLLKVERRATQLERLLLKKLSEKRAGWDKFTFAKQAGATVSSDGHAIQVKQDPGLFVTVHGATSFKHDKHSYRLHLTTGGNAFVGFAYVDEKAGAPSQTEFVGQETGVSLHTNVGHIIVNGTEIALGDFAICKQGDDVGVHIDLTNKVFLFFKNGAALHRPLPLPPAKHGFVWQPAVTLCSSEQTVTLNFTHPEDEDIYLYTASPTTSTAVVTGGTHDRKESKSN